MAWYDRIIGRAPQADSEKLNPAQPYYDHKTESSREPTFDFEKAYEDLEIVNRGVNMLVDDCAEINVSVGNQLPTQSVVKGIKRFV